MKILFPYLARWKAVNWTRYHSMFDALAKAGHKVYVLQAPAARSEETNFQEIKAELPENLRLHDVSLSERLWNLDIPFSKIFKKGYYSIACMKKVSALVKSEKIEAIFLYNIPQYPLMRFKNCFRIFDLADDYIAMLGHELGALKNAVALKIAVKVLDKMIQECDLAIAVSNVLAKASGKNVLVLPNGVDLEKMKRTRNAPVKINRSGTVIGFIGAFEYFIDFELILEVVARLPDFTFILVGTGREWKKVVKASRDRRLTNVLFTGGVPHEQVFAYVNVMDICLNIFKKIPVSHGACPIKLFEYLAMKKPVISTRLKELEYIDKGFIYYGDTASEIVDQIKRIIEKRSETNIIIEKGYSEVLQNYTWQKIADRFAKLVEAKKFPN